MADDEQDDMEETTTQEKEEKEAPSKGPKKKFEVKKWNAVALWAWGKNSIILLVALDII
jgi:hypothetical protein